MTNDEKSKPHVLELDWLRGIAALLVCAGHLRNAMIVDWNMAGDHSLIQKFLYGITGLGHQSVMVFFVLSGYLVGGSVISAGLKFQWPAYLLARLCRLWVVLIPCLLLTWIADGVITQIANDVLTGSFAARWHSAPVTGQYSISVQTLVGNIFFLQTIYFPVFGSNGPLWSLANEFWYYVMFPLAWLSIGKGARVTVVSRTIFGALMLLVFFSLPATIQFGFLVWLLGVLVAYLHHIQKFSNTSRFSWVLKLICLLLAVGFSKWSATQDWTFPWGDWVLGLAVGIFLLSVLQRVNLRRGTASKANGITMIARRLSNLSFTLYLSHFPLVLLVSTTFFHAANLQPTLKAWGSYCGILLGLLLVAQMLWWAFERNTLKVKRFIARQHW